MLSLTVILLLTFAGWWLAFVSQTKLSKVQRELYQLKERRAYFANAKQSTEQAETALINLIILRLTLQQMACAEDLEADSNPQLLNHIDELWADHLNKTGLEPQSQSWQDRRDAGWRMLVAHGYVPHGPIPWQAPATSKTSLKERAKPAREPAVPSVMKTGAEVDTPRSSTQVEQTDIVESTSTASDKPREQSPLQIQTYVSPNTTEVVHVDKTSAEPQSHAWRPSPPNALEKALRVVSGWPRAMLPFLIQNIGWFIGAFCFIAGSIFLVSYTTGFTKALTVTAALFVYTGFLIWAGYQLRLKRPKVKAASSVLMLTGMLLVPVNFSAAARLIMSAGDFWLLWMLAGLTTAVMLGVFYFSAQVISGVVDRVLQGRFPRLFLLLAGVQLLVPLLAWWPAWPMLALAHVTLLGMLGYGLVNYVKEWLRSIFVDQRKIAYFASGTLLYAALVSFFHLTWGAGISELPTGYYAPYLMAVCGLLFYVEAHFKRHVHQDAFLSRFTFLIYGLSVLAVLMTLDGPLARIITLSMASVVYGVVVWKYLTFVPLYLLTAALAALYASLVLAHFTNGWHFLLTLPPLFGVLKLSRWLKAQRSGRPGVQRLTLASFRLVALTLIAVAAWSLFHSNASVLAASTALALAGFLWWMLRNAPGPMLSSVEQAGAGELDLRNTPWLYAVILAVTAALVFAPRGPLLPWPLQLSAGLIFLAVLWTFGFLGLHRFHACGRSAQVEVLVNSALLSAFAAGGMAIWVFVAQTLQLDSQGFSIHCPGGASLELAIVVAVLGGISGVFFTLSLKLFVRWLFYAFLLLIAVAAAIFKLGFFPGPSVGINEIVLGLVLWGILWWLDRQPDPVSDPAKKRAQFSKPLTLLWLCSSYYETGETLVADYENSPETQNTLAGLSAPSQFVSTRGNLHV
jgi:hypothetical protein